MHPQNQSKSYNSSEIDGSVPKVIKQHHKNHLLTAFFNTQFWSSKIPQNPQVAAISGADDRAYYCIRGCRCHPDGMWAVNMAVVNMEMPWMA
jgi:hypothetical protein